MTREERRGSRREVIYRETESGETRGPLARQIPQSIQSANRKHICSRLQVLNDRNYTDALGRVCPSHQSVRMTRGVYLRKIADEAPFLCPKLQNLCISRLCKAEPMSRVVAICLLRGSQGGNQGQMKICEAILLLRLKKYGSRRNNQQPERTRMQI